MSLAFVFPGQGSQHVGMGRSLHDALPESRRVFERADAALGLPLSRLCFEGPESELGLTANTQPALLTASVAAWAALQAGGARPAFVAGHSLGEYSALVAAGVLSFEDALVAVRRRGQYMQQAVPVGEGAMAAILALDLAAVEAACQDAAQGQVVSPANLNSPGQVVVAGHAAAVERVIEGCKARGARRALKLDVSAPFHCALMLPAQERMAADLQKLPFADPAMPVVSNADARVVFSGNECREALVRQVSLRVRWQESIELLLREGVTSLVEVGPGKVLSGLIRKIDKGVTLLNAQDEASVQATLAVLLATTT